MNSSQTFKCAICGEGRVSEVHESQSYSHAGVEGRVRVSMFACDTCGSHFADSKFALDNKRQVIRFKKQVENVPLGQEIARMRRAHNLTQGEAGKLFGGGPVAFSKYENDDILPSEAMANLLRLAIRYPDTIARLSNAQGVKGTTPILVVEKKYGIENGCWLEVQSSAVDCYGAYAGPERRKRTFPVVGHSYAKKLVLEKEEIVWQS